MFFFSRRPRLSIEEVQATDAGTKMLSFDPSAIIRAITFHLLDEGKARAVNCKSSAAAIQKLCQRKNHLTISADQWATMGNAERLQWLLKQSRIDVKPGPCRTAALCVRRWPIFDAIHFQETIDVRNKK